ncbi:hypothetical protein [Aneurinibacillus terranovensis]|uniref:hypothetical protein n=1 Tax=Aneurinibacillus terranovensis TaxID=278991 RepID=UPI0012DFD44E|nr:hypothetical protein [Aneurinibacillus terranovensis]
MKQSNIGTLSAERGMRVISWFAAHRKRILSFLILVLVMYTIPADARADVKKADYLALGDSLAAGQTPYYKVGKGYPDYLAETMRSAGYKVTLDKRYAVPGYTNENLYLPNPVDIHPSGQGYKVIAGEFWNHIKNDFASKPQEKAVQEEKTSDGLLAALYRFFEWLIGKINVWG